MIRHNLKRTISLLKDRNSDFWIKINFFMANANESGNSIRVIKAIKAKAHILAAMIGSSRKTPSKCSFRYPTQTKK